MSVSDRIAKYMFLGSIAISGLGGSFLYGVVAYWKDLPPVPAMRTAWNAFKSDSIFEDLRSDIRHHLQPSRGQGDGVITNQTDDDAIVFMMGFFDGENQARLVERDGTVLHHWSLNYFDHFPDEEQRYCNVNSPLEVDTHGALVTKSGELVFNYEYCGTVKLDQCGSVMWTIADDTHHSLTRAEQGGYWLLGRFVWSPSEEPGRFPPFSTAGNQEAIQEDTIMRVSDTGEILEEVSIPVLMRDSGLLPLLTATGDSFDLQNGGRSELVHANKLTELPQSLADAYPLFDAGDLAISMRELNLVMVLDGETRAVKWHQVGPWLRQHDPEFRPDGRISIFNNNVFKTASYRGGQTDIDSPFATNIILVDPVTNETEVRFGERQGQEMLSVIRGQHELLPDDGMIITEFDAGRVLEVDASGQIVWEYVNRYDDDHVGEIRNADVIPRTYFNGSLPSTASCE